MFSTFILQHTEMFESIFSKSILSIVLRGTNYLCVLFCFVFFFFGGGGRFAYLFEKSSIPYGR